MDRVEVLGRRNSAEDVETIAAGLLIARGGAQKVTGSRSLQISHGKRSALEPHKRRPVTPPSQQVAYSSSQHTT